MELNRRVQRLLVKREERLGTLAKSISHYVGKDLEEMLARFKEAGFDWIDPLNSGRAEKSVG